ncbi:hypothetical protein [Nitrincola sp. MINF-07-Sa-05]|uniref:hypothetical protein n=1 Tax=Nitrincola salilacus TaxID=3400273 RepID=UPI0039183601
MAIQRIEYTHTFENQLHQHLSWLAKYVGAAAAERQLLEVLDQFEARVRDHPVSAPVCEEAADLGLTDYHDYVDTTLQVRIIYRFDPSAETILGMLFLNTRQSMRDALVQLCLRQE